MRFAMAQKVVNPEMAWIVDVFILSKQTVFPVTIFGARDAKSAEQDALATFAPTQQHDIEVISVMLAPDC